MYFLSLENSFAKQQAFFSVWNFWQLYICWKWLTDNWKCWVLWQHALSTYHNKERCWDRCHVPPTDHTCGDCHVTWLPKFWNILLDFKNETETVKDTYLFLLTRLLLAIFCFYTILFNISTCKWSLLWLAMIDFACVITVMGCGFTVNVPFSLQKKDIAWPEHHKFNTHLNTNWN